MDVRARTPPESYTRVTMLTELGEGLWCNMLIVPVKPEKAPSKFPLLTRFASRARPVSMETGKVFKARSLDFIILMGRDYQLNQKQETKQAEAEGLEPPQNFLTYHFFSLPEVERIFRKALILRVE